jgi:hypothetical protein
MKKKDMVKPIILPNPEYARKSAVAGQWFLFSASIFKDCAPII